MRNTAMPPGLKELVQKYQLPSSQLGFGQVMAPAMTNCEYRNGAWGALELLPYGPLSMAPTCKVLHYAQEIFEGLKAYGVDGKGPYLFRPLENARRMNASAERMAMPTIPEELFMEACESLVRACPTAIPRRTGESLYLRPFMYASEEGLGIRPAEQFRFLVIGSPSGTYFTGEDMRLYIEREGVRASPGGTGYAKTGGNYAVSLRSTARAKSLGMNQSLWLDSKHQQYVEELSGMNFFAVVKDELHTPLLSDTILKGVTRDSILRLAKDHGLKAREMNIDIQELLGQIKTGECSEAFACGTAAIITPISIIGEADGTRLPLKNPGAPVGMQLRKKLLDIQEGRAEDPYGWRIPVGAAPLN